MLFRLRPNTSIVTIALTILLSTIVTSLHALTTVTSTSANFIGFDFGTSGARISIIVPTTTTPNNKNDNDNDNSFKSTPSSYHEIHSSSISWSPTTTSPYDSPQSWTDAIHTLLSSTPPTILSHTKSIAISGTSASCLAINKKTHKVTRHPRMYDYDILSSSSSSSDGGSISSSGVKAMELLHQYVPSSHTALSRTGSLAKLTSWMLQDKWHDEELFCHQADYLASYMSFDKMCGRNSQSATTTLASDWHNCLKLGYDVKGLRYPSWLESLLDNLLLSSSRLAPLDILPRHVVSPGDVVVPQNNGNGAVVRTISRRMAKRYGMSPDVSIVGGTTDSNAAFIAAVGGLTPPYGTAVVSLGSTLAVKQTSRAFVEDVGRGVYSHRFPVVGRAAAAAGSGGGEEAWLIGGASNVGCAILRKEGFSNEELERLSLDIDPRTESPLAYYPLTKRGERFPIADGDKEPIMEPVPPNRRDYLHGILQGISDVERDGFEVLGSLGADPPRPTVVMTSGGGARNEMWRRMRERRLGGVEVKVAGNREASFGAAILAAAPFVG